MPWLSPPGYFQEEFDNFNVPPGGGEVATPAVQSVAGEQKSMSFRVAFECSVKPFRECRDVLIIFQDWEPFLMGMCPNSLETLQHFIALDAQGPGMPIAGRE